jgi:hypothetical protein
MHSFKWLHPPSLINRKWWFEPENEWQFRPRYGQSAAIEALVLSSAPIF